MNVLITQSSSIFLLGPSTSHQQCAFKFPVCMKFVFKTVKMNTVAFWAMISCGFVGEPRRFEEISCLLFSSEERMAAGFFATLATVYIITSESREREDNNHQYQCSSFLHIFIATYRTGKTIAS